MGHCRNTSLHAVPQRRQARRALRLQTVSAAGLFAVAAALPGTAFAGSDIATGSTYLASNLGGSVNAVFSGGTLELDESKTISRGFTLNDVSTNTIDIYGSTVTMSGAFTGAGPVTIADSKSGGSLTLTSSSNAYTGATTIDSGAVLALADYGIISTSSGLTDNGTFDISNKDTLTYVTTLDGSGTVILGSQSLALSGAAGTFSGTISGAGGFSVSSGTEVLTGINTYTGSTTIASGTLVLSGNGSIASSNNVVVYGDLDLSQATNPALKSLTGSGDVVLGSQTLTLTSATGTFSGTISGTGNLILNGGTEYLTGANDLAGTVIVNAGTLQVGSATIAYDISNNATFAFYSASAVTMNGVVSGPGAVMQIGSGVTTVTLAQTYSGPTTISGGTLALSGAGSIAASSNVIVDGTLEIAGTSGTSITSLSGSGTVSLGAANLTLTNASGTFTGGITGTGNLILAAGTETFSGTSTFSGTTTIASGTLTLRPVASLAKASIVDNAVLDVSAGTGTTFSGTATIGSLSGGGSVTLGANGLQLAAANDEFAGIISGTGNFTIGGGEETLSGANTYTGTTSVAAGASLVLSATGSLDPASSIAADGTFDATALPGTSITFASLSGAGAIRLGAHSLTLTNATGVFAGAIQSSGGLKVAGGTEILTGTNSYTGGTTIDAGATLQLGNTSTGGSIAGDVTDNGTLTFDRSDTSIFSGTISGTGAVVQSGSGITILTAANTYTGGTTISRGTLQIGNGGTSGAIYGNVTDNGTLTFARSDNTEFGAVISGTGGVTFASGTTKLTAAESYTGATAIASGATLVLGGTGSIATSQSVTDNGILDVSAVPASELVSLSGSGAVKLGSQSLTLTSAAGTFSGAISGSGGLTLGAGMETLSGTNSYTGSTKINGGTLTVTGSIASSSGVTVNAAGTLAGTGTVSSITINSGGTLSAGSSGTGTLTSTGAVSFASGSTYAVGITANSITKLSTSGSASLAGTLTVTSQDGTYLLGQKQTVLTASGGVTGSFTLTQVASTGAEFTSALSYDADNVYLRISLAKLSPLLPSGVGTNQANAIAAVDAAIAAGDTLPEDFENLGNASSETLAADAVQLAGEIGSDLPQIGPSLMTPFLDAIFDHVGDGQLNGPFPARRQGLQKQTEIWGSAFGGTRSISADASGTETHKFRLNAAGVVAGADLTVLPNLMLGGTLSAGTSDFHLAGDNGFGNAGFLQAGLYGFARYSPHFYGTFAAAAALDRITTHRVLTISDNETLTAKLTAVIIGGRYETGVLLSWATPYLAVQDVLSMLPAYGETATSGSFALHYDARTVNSGRSELGLRHSMDVDVSPQWILTPDWTMHLSERIAWAHDFFGANQTIASFAALPASKFTVTGVKPTRDSALVSLGAEFRFENGLRVNARFDSMVSSNSQTYVGFAGVGYAW